MILAMIILFSIGYFLIAIEHKTHVNKAAIAILLAISLWVLYMFSGADIISGCNLDAFKHYVENNGLQNESIGKQCAKFVAQFQIVESLGSLTQILFYLVAAMTIVETIDAHNGFAIITDRIKTTSKRKLLFTLSIMTFFMSAILDNLTTAIVMTILTRKLIADKQDRWIFIGIIIIAANSGGAWTPMGDVTTIMLWINENVTSIPLVKTLFLPSVVSLLVPVLLASVIVGRGQLKVPESKSNAEISYATNAERNIITTIGVLGLLSIPVFKALTGLPPFMGVLFILGIIWVYVGLIYDKKTGVPEDKQFRIARILPRIDLPTIFFFLGILLAVDALQCAGILSQLSEFLDKHVHNIYVINPIIGVISAVVDNVPLVAGAMRMYDTPTMEAVNTVALTAPEQAAYMQNFVQDGHFWQLLAYCAGTGGSILIIGSAAGVVAMGLERITFFWYLKRIAPLAFAGYAAGIGVYILQTYLF